LLATGCCVSWDFVAMPSRNEAISNARGVRTGLANRFPVLERDEVYEIV
jgi:hypothetical protein